MTKNIVIIHSRQAYEHNIQKKRKWSPATSEAIIKKMWKL